MELLQLRYFCEVVKWGNVTRAAKENYISQPALSKTIRNLEDELGVKLFERVKNRVELNEYGRAFYDKVSRGLQMIDSGVEGLKLAPDSERGEITLIVKAGQYLFPEFYDSFSRRYPDITLDVANFTLIQRRILSEYDFHISAFFIADSGNYCHLKLCWPKRNFEGKRFRLFRVFAEEYFSQLQAQFMEEKKCRFHNNCIIHMEYALRYF